MNRRGFVKGTFVVAGTAVLPRFAFATEGEKKMKTAVVYFSWSGNTRFAAETIAKKTGADLFEIKAEKPYNNDVGKCCDEAKPECNGKKLRTIKPIEGLDLAKYDVVFVGSPNWWGTMAPPVRTWVTQSKDALNGMGFYLSSFYMWTCPSFDPSSFVQGSL